ncbi:MAG: DCC1-like thiol-disulfide oxidoreductase family protein, partial [Microcystaceae cyanobacterium]
MKNQLRLWICVGSALAGCLLVAFEKLFFPKLSAQNGLLICLGFGVITWITTSPAFFRKCVGEATPESLGAIRILVCAIQLMMTLWMEDLPSMALLPVEMRHPMGNINLLYSLPGFESFVRSQTSLQIFEWLTASILFLGLIGWQTRIFMPLGAFFYIILGGILRQYSWFYHTGLLPAYMMAVLSFTPCADGLSVDRLWKVYRGQPVPESDKPAPIYGWSRYACWVVLAISYVQAGLSKIYKGGWFWWDPTNMRSILYSQTLDPVQANWEVSLQLVHAPDIVFALLGIAGMYGEIAYGLVLFSKIARKILPIFMASVHIGIWFLQDIVFLDLIILQLIFYDFTQTRKTIQRWIAAREEPIQVLYDGFCPFCQRTIRLLDCFDIFERLQFIDFRQLNLADYNEKYNLSLTQSELEAEMYVISRGRAYVGFYGYRVIARVLPIFWLLVPWLYLPGISSLGKRIYRKIAQNRFNLIQCDSSCDIKSLPIEKSTRLLPWNETLKSIYYPLYVSGLIVVLSFIWFKHIENYPITTLQMFSSYSN